MFRQTRMQQTNLVSVHETIKNHVLLDYAHWNIWVNFLPLVRLFITTQLEIFAKEVYE